MNPYEVSQTSLDTIQSLLEAAAQIQGADDLRAPVPSTLGQLEQRLVQLQQVHSRSWHLLRHNNEHAEFIMARLESMDVLCGRLLPMMDAARAIFGRKSSLKKSASLRLSGSSGFSCCIAVAPRDDLLEFVEAMSEELAAWLDYQESILELLSCQKFGVFPRLKTQTLEVYQPLESDSKIIREALVGGSQRCVIVSGPSGVGKSCLAAFLASNPPDCFSDGAVEVHFGKITGKDSFVEDYERRLIGKLKILLQELNCSKDLIQKAGSARECWCLVGEMLEQVSFLVVLDDVCDKEIVDRVMQFRNHSCKFFITCQDDPVYESDSVCSIRLGFKETATVSKKILQFHTGITRLPAGAAKLLKYCSHHPLSVAILGEALRGSWRRDEWKAVVNHFESCSGGTQKQQHSSRSLNWLAGVFGSIELSMVAMNLETQQLFDSMAALSWSEPVPVECLKALWSAVGNETPFLPHARELVRRCLLKRRPDFVYYELHELVEMFLERKVSQAVEVLLDLSQPSSRAVVAPWLLHFGNREAKQAACGAIRNILVLENEELHAKSLAGIVDVLKSCRCSSSKDEICKELNSIVGPEIVNLLFRASSASVYSAITKYIAACFTDADYEQYGKGLLASGLIEKLRLLLYSHSVNILVKKDVTDVLARLARSSCRDKYVAESLSRVNLIRELVQLLDSHSGWIHEGATNAVVELASIGEDTMQQMLETDMLDKLVLLLHNRKHLVKIRALGTLELLLRRGGRLLADKILNMGMLGELESLLGCSSEEVQIAACSVCKELFRGAASDPCPENLERILKTKLVENLTGLLRDELEVLRSRAGYALQILVRARGKCVADRVVRAAGFESFQKGLQSAESGCSSAHRRLLKSIVDFAAAA